MDRDLAIITLVRYLHHRLDAGLLTGSEHLDRAVAVASPTWRLWLLGGGRPDTSTFVGPPTRARARAVTTAFGALAPLPASGRSGHTADTAVHRDALAAAAVRAATSPRQRECVALWILATMWGAGTTDSRAPWHTAQALADPRSGTAITRSFRALRRGDLADAYDEAAAITAAGQGSTTHWLWAAGVGLDADRGVEPHRGSQPVPLDRTSRRGLDALGVRVPQSWGGYVTYLALLDEILDGLTAATGRDDLDREWLEHQLGGLATAPTLGVP